MGEKIYLYCIVDCKNGTVKAGVNNTNLINIVYDDVMVVGEMLPKDRLEVNLENLKKHEQIVEMYMQDNILPIRFNTFVDNIETAKRYIKENYSNIIANLNNVSNKTEMGLKVFWDLEKVKRDIKLENNKIDDAGISEGKKYIYKMMERYLIEKELKNEANKIASFFRENLKECICNFKEKLLFTETMPLNAAYLIEKDNIGVYRSIIENLKKEREDLYIISTGPWPPYNFVDISLGGEI